MMLYHGSNVEIDRVDLNKCRPYKDFGRGFYLTTMKGQAFQMAKRVSRIYGGLPCVTCFEFDENAFDDDDIHVRTFDHAMKEWALFVINNRNRNLVITDDTEHNQDNRYDIVIGCVANDDLALLFRQFSSGLIGAATLVKEMEYKKLTDQYSFHSEKALYYLKRIGCLYE